MKLLLALFSVLLGISHGLNIRDFSMNAVGAKNFQSVLYMNYKSDIRTGTNVGVELVLPGSLDHYKDISCTLIMDNSKPKLTIKTPRQNFVSISYSYTAPSNQETGGAVCAYTAPQVTMSGKAGVYVSVNGDSFFGTADAKIVDVKPIAATFTSTIAYSPSHIVPSIFQFSTLPELKAGTTLEIGRVRKSSVSSWKVPKMFSSHGDKTICAMTYLPPYSSSYIHEIVNVKIQDSIVSISLPQIQDFATKVTFECPTIGASNKMVDKTSVIEAVLLADSTTTAYSWVIETEKESEMQFRF